LSAEFAIRPFIKAYPQASLDLFTVWAKDPNQDIRRLVSEGTRPRLPWATRLPQFIDDPSPLLALLEQLKDDPALYVRRSVANNLNDIGKDHPQLLASLAKDWLKGASKERQWLVRHALRSAVKRGEKGALEALGYGNAADISIQNIKLSATRVTIGESLELYFEPVNQSTELAQLMVDFKVFFVKANGHSSAKVFKLKALQLAPNETQTFSKKISLKLMSTRPYYSGKHRLEAIINGKGFYLADFTLDAL
jgi:3-methyladenine DNA glycosylase AlkC